MNYVQKAKMHVARGVVGQMSKMFASASDESLIKMTQLIEKLMITETQKQYVCSTRIVFEQGHPIMNMIKKLLSRDIHSNYHKNLVISLITNSVIYSPFFMSIREHLRLNNKDNLLLPCIIIDHPETLRKLVAEYGAYPTHDGAETVITEMSDYLDQYAVEYRKLADEAWKIYGKKDIWTRDVWMGNGDEM